MIARRSIEGTGARRYRGMEPICPDVSKTPHYRSHIPTSKPPDFGGWAEGGVPERRAPPHRQRHRSGTPLLACVTAPQRVRLCASL